MRIVAAVMILASLDIKFDERYGRSHSHIHYYKLINRLMLLGSVCKCVNCSRLKSRIFNVDKSQPEMRMASEKPIQKSTRGGAAEKLIDLRINYKRNRSLKNDFHPKQSV